MNIKIKLIIVVLIVSLAACKEEFYANNKDYQANMVIDGLISNEEGPYTITVSKSAPVNEFKHIPLEGCTVTIFEKSETEENSEELTEIEPGTYQTSENGIQGTVGNSYSLSVVTPDGQEYITEYQKMKEPVEIESIKYELGTEVSNQLAFELPGYQFYVSSKEAENRDNYLIWKLTETYEYTNDYKLADFFLGYESVFITEDSFIVREIQNDTLLTYFNQEVFTCWKTQSVNYIYTGKTNNLSIPKINNQPLQFVGTETKRLSEQYSLLVKQYTIDEQAYYYWKAIEDQSTDENFLIANQPYSITGNFININDNSDLIFGYFTVASADKKRIFADRPNKPFYYEKCVVVTDPFSIGEIEKNQSPPFFYVNTDNGEGLIDEKNIDCRNEGGSLSKPDFWID